MSTRRMMRWSIAVIGASLLGAGGCSPDRSHDAPHLVISNATIIDGTGAPPRPNQTIVVEGSRVVAVGPVGSISIPAGSKVVDGSDQWVIPGFVDLHVHLPPDTALHAPVLARLLEFGITSILNPGARPGAGPDVRARIARGELLGPQMRTAGALIDVTPEDRGYSEWAVQTPTESAIREEIRAQVGLGVDWVKLYAGLGPELVEAGLDEARALGVPVVGHLEATGWTPAARMGVKMLVHSGWATPMDEIVNLPSTDDASDAEWYRGYADAPNGSAFRALVEALLDSGVVVVPTLSITQASAFGNDATLLPLFQTELAPERHLPGWWDEGWETRHPQYWDREGDEALMMDEVYFPAVLAIQKVFFERGVTLGVGTDVGNSWMTPGVSFHHELGLYQEAGIPPIDILTMATRNGADAIGLGASTGTIEVGKRADLVILDADPTIDIRNARQISHVFLAGREIQRR